MGRLSFQKDGTKNDTDQIIREALFNDCLAGKVSIWVKKCDYSESEITIAGAKTIVYSKMHKDLEKKYLDHYHSLKKCYPYLNSGRA